MKNELYIQLREAFKKLCRDEGDKRYLRIGEGTPGEKGDKGDAGPGVPAGGTARQVAMKVNSTDYSVAWEDNISHPFLGTYTNSDITYGTGGQITLSSTQAVLLSETDEPEQAKKYTVAGATFTLTDNALNYIVVDYNAGTPIYRVTLTEDEINEKSIILIYAIYRTGDYLHTLNFDLLGRRLANKIHTSIIKTQRFRREYGAILSEYGTRNIRVSEGSWYVGVNNVLTELAESGNNPDTLMFEVYKSAGVWTYNIVTQYNNTEYDNGTDKVTLTDDRYAVLFFYRGIENQKHIYYTLGQGDYLLSEAQRAQPVTPPQLIASHAALIGKLIVKKGDNTAFSIQSVFDVFATSATSNDTATAIGGNVAWTNYSDKRLKEDIKELKSELDKINKLRPVSFKWKEVNEVVEKVDNLGLIAQEVREIYPEVVKGIEEKETLSMEYTGLIAPLIKAVQELTEQNKILFEQNKELFERIETLENKLKEN